MKTALVIAVPLGVLFTLFAWRISELLSPDAIGMAIGMLFGVLAGVPTAALVLVASRRGGGAQYDGWVDVNPMDRDGRIRITGSGLDGVYLPEPAERPEVQADYEIVKVHHASTH